MSLRDKILDAEERDKIRMAINRYDMACVNLAGLEKVKDYLSNQIGRVNVSINQYEVELPVEQLLLVATGEYKRAQTELNRKYFDDVCGVLEARKKKD